VSALGPGDRFVVRPGEAIAADGVVEFGESAVGHGHEDRGTGARGCGRGLGGDRGDDTQLAHPIALVERAQADKSAVQRLADGRGERAFSVALAVLIIACPCALGLATPAALAGGRGAQLGIFIKGYQALEASRSVDTVLLYKTGTVTTRVMAVAAAEALEPGLLQGR
jgi:cation transport ATPase